jgi:hypothetical protein
VGIGIYPDVDVSASAMTRVTRRVEPDPELSGILARRRKIFEILRGALGPVWRSPGGDL